MIRLWVFTLRTGPCYVMLCQKQYSRFAHIGCEVCLLADSLLTEVGPNCVVFIVQSNGSKNRASKAPHIAPLGVR